MAYDLTSKTASRRRLLLMGMGGAGVATLAGAAASAPAPSRTLKLTAETTEGPYYLEPVPVRSDITGGRTGIPVEVRLTVLDQTGAPLPGALVDLWHCDARGLYSGFPGQGDTTGVDTRGMTFLRGRQTAGADGVAAFRTIYPGWYRGRTTHIHFKVANGGLTNLTSQFFLPDALSEYLYTSLSAYKRDSVRDTLNSLDGILLQAGDTVSGSVREERGRYVISLTVVVDPKASPRVDRPPVPGQGQSPGGPGARPGQSAPGARTGGGAPSGAGGPGGRPPGGGGPGGAGGPPPGGGRGGPGPPGGVPNGMTGGPPPTPGQLPQGLTGEARAAAIVPGAPVVR